MSKETIELLTILRDETQSRAVHARCVAEINRIDFDLSKTLAAMWAAINHPKANAEADVSRALKDAAIQGMGYLRVGSDGTMQHLPAEYVRLVGHAGCTCDQCKQVAEWRK